MKEAEVFIVTGRDIDSGESVAKVYKADNKESLEKFLEVIGIEADEIRLTTVEEVDTDLIA